jgi:sigma-B regulation protein RsbU (phosphoserine phosphatase)
MLVAERPGVGAITFSQTERFKNECELNLAAIDKYGADEIKLKIKYKILFLYLSTSIFILILIGGLLSSNLRDNIIHTISNNYSMQLSHIDFALTSFFRNIEHDLEAIAQNETVRSRNDEKFTTFIDADEDLFQYNYSELEQKIITIFNNYRTTHPYVHSVYMGRENGSFVRSHKRARPTRYDPRTRPWYILGKENPGKITRTPPFRSVTTPDISIGFVKALLGIEGTPYGVIGVAITLSDLTEYVSKIELDYRGALFLLDEYGTIIASRDKSLLFTDLENYDTGLYEKVYKNNEAFCIFEKDLKKRYAFFYTSPASDWKLGVTVPLEEIYRDVWSFDFKILFALFLALLLLSALTLIGLQRFVINPLKELNEGTDIIARTGDLNHHIEIKSQDEIGNLATSFNTMTKDLKKYIKQLAETTVARERIESELKIAHDIQMGILPKEFPSFQGEYEVDIYAVLEPAKHVGGDLYDFFLLSEDQLCFTIGDVSGKGVPAAVFMSAVKTLIKATAKSIDKPSAILRIVNEEISKENEYATFVTVFLGLLNVRTGEMCYTNAGHNPPLILRKDRNVEFLTGGKNLALGIDEEFSFIQDTVTLKTGEGIFLYTDGVTEAFNSKGELFSAERLQQDIADCQNNLSKELVSNILKNIQSFSKDVPQSDDITMLTIRYRPDKNQSL